jgi:hypothetical protein
MKQIFYSVFKGVSPVKQLEEGVENGCIEIEVPGRRRRTLTTSTMRGTSMAIMATSTTMTATTTTPFGVWGVEAGVLCCIGFPSRGLLGPKAPLTK